MSKPKKGAIYNAMFPMVDATDFATIESAVTTLSGITYYGINHGAANSVTSGIPSNSGSVVHSGIFTVRLGAAENNYDNMMLRVRAAGCADQLLTWENVDHDESDIMSQFALVATAAVLSDFYSDFQSRVPSLVATASNVTYATSDIKSALAATQSDLRSQAIAIQSDVKSMLKAMSDTDSKVYAMLSDMQSDFQSRVPSLVATASNVTYAISDIKSAITAATSPLATAAVLSDFYSDFQSKVPSLVATASNVTYAISDIKSALAAVQSDLRSQAIAIQSDVKSGLGAIAVTLTTSDISNIASAVASAGGGATQSQVQVIVDAAKSDIKSQATATYATLSDFYSDFQSRVPSLVATASNVTYAISDIKSALTAVQSDLRSQAIAIQSDIKSQATATYATLSDFYSDFQSRVPSLVATPSNITAATSDIKSAITAAQSDIRSQATAIQSDIKSQVTATYAMLSDLQSDFQSRVPSQVGTPSQITAAASDIKSAIAALDTLLDKFAPLIIGTVTQAGTASEIFVYGGVTATVVADASGNRASVTFS